MIQEVSVFLPDTQDNNLAPADAVTIDQVGMTHIALPVELEGKPVNGFADIHVNLLGESLKRGIHMSRLYLSLDQLTQCELTPTAILDFLTEVIHSQGGHSSRAEFAFQGDIYLSRPALVSPLRGWKSYTLRLEVSVPAPRIILSVRVPYSSTCPCSTELSCQVLTAQLMEHFPQDAMLKTADVTNWLQQSLPATPHSQRSWANVSVAVSPHESFPVTALIDCIESALQTPVQTAVKRQDEQAFAIANAQNLMFCEDAVRRLYGALHRRFPRLRVCVEHQESLHAHQATACIDRLTN